MRDRLPLIAFLASLAALGVLYGNVAAQFDLFPHPQVRSVWKASKSFKRKLSAASFKYEARHAGSGVTVCDSSRAFDGVTFFSAQGDDAFRAYLIDMRGEVLHRWAFELSDIFEEPRVPKTRIDDSGLLFRGRLLPDGSIYALVLRYGGLIKVDRDSKVVLRIDRSLHHDLDTDAAGNVYALSREAVPARYAGVRIDHQFYDDHVVKFSPAGEVLWEFSLTDAILRSDYAHLLSITYHDSYRLEGVKEPLHTNNVEILRPEMASMFPLFRPGDILVSFRDMNTVAVVDRESQTLKWALTGPFVRQHDPDFLSSGHLLVFDNRGHSGEGGGSRVLEIDPLSQRVVWAYGGDAAQPFFTRTRGAQQRLPNGNTLVTDSNSGRIFEVTPGGEIVWNYLNALAPRQGQPRVGLVQDAARFQREELPFLDRD